MPGGRGIGLALVRLVSAQLGGTVEITDAPTGGARFKVRLRIPPARATVGAGRGPMRDVLVVDDDFMVAEIHRKFVDHVDGFSRRRRGAHRRRGPGAWRPRCAPTSSCSTCTSPT